MLGIIFYSVLAVVSVMNTISFIMDDELSNLIYRNAGAYGNVQLPSELIPFLRVCQ